MSCLLVGHTSALDSTESSANQAGNLQDWIVYKDTRFDFSVEYPTTWSLDPREDVVDTFGERLIISEPISTIEDQAYASESVQIEVGFYLVELLPGQSLADWSDSYDLNHDEFDTSRIIVFSKGEWLRSDRESYYKEAISPMTAYTYINISDGLIVWNIWVNSVTEEHKAILEHVANSITFGENAPKNLNQAYGNDFIPQPLEPNNATSSNTLENDWRIPVNASLSGYRVPVTVYSKTR